MDDTRSCVVTAAGVGTVDIQPRFGQSWEISQISVRMLSAPGSATCVLTKNGAYVTDLIPQGDVAGDPPPLPLTASDHAVITWSGCTPGAIGNVTFFYDQVDQ